MIATQNQTATNEKSDSETDAASFSTQGVAQDSPVLISNVTNLQHSVAKILPNRTMMMHHPKSGLNPIVDAANSLFSLLGTLKQLKSHHHLSQLQKEIIQEIQFFHDTIKNQSYPADYILVCQYIMCVVFDDIITHTAWGYEQWHHFSLLAAFNHRDVPSDKFFSIMQHATAEPARYIYIMELMYICLSMGYKGIYRATEHDQFKLEQITDQLYKHIRAYRGSFNKALSPAAPKHNASVAEKLHTPSLRWIVFATLCAMMVVFISLGYLMDIISNETNNTLTAMEKSVSNDLVNQAISSS